MRYRELCGYAVQRYQRWPAANHQDVDPVGNIWKYYQIFIAILAMRQGSGASKFDKIFEAGQICSSDVRL
jgi:hypothetical protein